MDPYQAQVDAADAFSCAEQWPEAVEAYAELVAVGRSDYRLHLHFGTALLYWDHHREACEQLSAALRYRPDSIEALNNLGCAYNHLSDHRKAEEVCRRLLAMQPNHPTAWSNLGLSLVFQGRNQEAIEALQRATEIQPENQGSRDNLLQVLNNVATDGQGLAEVHRALCADRLSSPKKPLPNHAGRRIRVGYVSSDFRLHSVAYFMAGIIGAHDRSAFDIYCYSANRFSDWMTRYFSEKAEHFVDISHLSDAEAAERIEADQIDILVDLSGHMAGNRLGMFSHRPAPVQATYLGYPATTGCSFMDFRLVDGLTDPDGSDACATERLIRLPGPFLCYSPFPDAPEIAPLPALASGHITFGSFNNATKISDETLDLWSRVLAGLPDSRLFIKASCFSDTTICDQFHQRFAQHGIDPARIDFSGLIASVQEHLGSYGKVDIALDTFPYHGTTTTCEALWMGVPVITLVGDLHAARVGLTLLTAVGLGGLATTSTADFVSLAVAFSEDKEQLANLRSHLRQVVAGSPLCDRARFTRGLEAAYRKMLAPEG